MADTSIFSQGPPQWLAQRALYDEQSVDEATQQGAGMLGRLTAAAVGAGVKSATKGTNFFTTFGEMYRKAGGVQEQAAWNKVQDMDLDLDQKKKEIFDQGQDAPKFAKWQADMSKDPSTPQPAWMSDKYRQAAYAVETQASMVQYRKGLIDVQKQKAYQGLSKQNDINDFNAALGAVDPEISADITNPDNGLVRYDQQGNIIGYTGDAIRALNQGLTAQGLSRFGPNWSKNQAAADTAAKKAQAATTLQTDKFAHISELLTQKNANAQALEQTKEIYAGTKDKAMFISRISAAMASNPSQFKVKKGDIGATAKQMADSLFGDQTTPETTGAQPTAADVSYLAAHPELKSKFEAKFGAGSADQYLP